MSTLPSGLTLAVDPLSRRTSRTTSARGAASEGSPVALASATIVAPTSASTVFVLAGGGPEKGGTGRGARAGLGGVGRGVACSGRVSFEQPTSHAATTNLTSTRSVRVGARLAPPP